MAVADGKVFASSSPQSSSSGSHPPALGWFDPGTHGSCAGWSTPLAIAAAGYYTHTAYPAYDTAGDAVGVCATTSSGNAPQAKCYAVDGSALAAPSERHLHGHRRVQHRQGLGCHRRLHPNTVNLPVAPGSNCKPKVTVNKEIYGSTYAGHCGPGGKGPRAKTSPTGLLGLLGTAYWRITVTNAGPVDAANVILDDHVAPSCESAAGTFDLQANESKQVYCSTYLLVLPLKNTVTASFTPANSPAGTPRTVTKPSSATACSLLCILTR